jgi:hypothetical protein
MQTLLLQLQQSKYRVKAAGKDSRPLAKLLSLLLPSRRQRLKLSLQPLPGQTLLHTRTPPLQRQWLWRPPKRQQCVRRLMRSLRLLVKRMRSCLVARQRPILHASWPRLKLASAQMWRRLPQRAKQKPLLVRAL